MPAVRKVTVEVPSDLLRKAQRTTRKGVTATITQGLELVASTKVYEKLRRLRGRVKFVEYPDFREDRGR
jgi:hypothetical protein